MAWKFFTNLGAEKTAWGNATDRGTTLPTSPSDGQEYNYVADATNGVVWTFKYNAGSGSAYKWEFIGGSPVSLAYAGGVFQNNGSFVTNSGWFSYQGVTTFLTPRAGDWGIVATQKCQAGAGASQPSIGVGIAGIPTSAGRSDITLPASAFGALVAQGVVAGVAAATYIGLGWSGSAPSTTTLADSTVKILPIRIA